MALNQQQLIHAGLGGLAVAGAVVLAITGHVTGDEALTVIVAAAGIGGTGIAASSSAPSTASPTAKPAGVTTGGPATPPSAPVSTQG